jgi:hypothetical protein
MGGDREQEKLGWLQRESAFKRENLPPSASSPQPGAVGWIPFWNSGQKQIILIYDMRVLNVAACAHILYRMNDGTGG